MVIVETPMAQSIIHHLVNKLIRTPHYSDCVKQGINVIYSSINTHALGQ